MSRRWAAWPAGVDPGQLRREVAAARERFLATGESNGAVRPVVADSWRRSVANGIDPECGGPPVELTNDELRAYREAHELRTVFPIVSQLLVDDAAEDGIVTAISDAAGRLLWLDGNRRQLARAEAIAFVEGANCGEAAVGTNAIGTALALDQPVQIFCAEHFLAKGHGWSCTAVPIHDPDTGAILGVLDVTGGANAASPEMLTVIRASVAAVEAELRIRQLAAGTVGQPARSPESRLGRLEVLGRDQGLLSRGSRTIELSPRHSELLFLLHSYPAGLTAEELAAAIHDRECSPITIRAEMARLRRILGADVIQSRPYRLRERLDTDVDELRALLDRGSHVRALDLYRGPLLPRSRAPRIVELRDEVRWALRGALLGHASGDDLYRYAQHPDSREDHELWRVCRDRLPLGSPQRTRAASHLAHLERILS